MTPYIRLSLLLGLLFLGVSQILSFVIPTAPKAIFYLHVAVGSVLFAYAVTQGGVQFLREQGSFRQSKRRNGAVLRITLSTVVVLLVVALFSRKELFQFDLTAGKIHTLSGETRGLIAELPGKLVIRAFYLGGIIPDEMIRAELQEFAKAGVQVEMIDPETDLLLLEQYGITQQETLHFSLTLPSGESRIARVAHVRSEEQIDTVLRKLIRSGPRIVVYSIGHGEPSLEEKFEKGALFFKETLEGENLQVQGLSLSSIQRLSDDVRMLVINAPIEGFSDGERKVVAEYMSRGGSLLLLNEPRTSREIAGMVKPFGIEIGDDFIVEPLPNGSLGMEMRLSEFSNRSPVTRGFTKSAILTGAGSVSLAANADERASAILASTSPSAWAERNLAQLFSSNPQASRGLEDLSGPVPVAVSFDGRLSTGKVKPRIIVFGDSDFIANAHLRALANGELLLSATSWLLGDGEKEVPRNRSMKTTAVKLGYEERQSIILFGGILLPEVLALVALTLWYRRL